MKIKLLFSVLLLVLYLPLLAQPHALVGTWIKGNPQRGIKETKIISPTQVGCMGMDTKRDTMIYTGFGTS
ncbi:hypothetical protein Q0590_32220 [Rhodocytophaga aerolata]|uniref:DUF4198 domain-containing protein n=1 Tax=Rhodocytophaga aerolata TaxID=455078 RepID=A0ABT8RJC1_9BACT|nr:hypothetical protein [Rhodocytophaga aerolata]MDO1450985.1 hypothetical protein [Rhodocytophaga aerolata]